MGTLGKLIFTIILVVIGFSLIGTGFLVPLAFALVPVVRQLWNDN